MAMTPPAPLWWLSYADANASRGIVIHEAKTELSKLLELVEHGENIVIARAGKPVALLTRYEARVPAVSGLFEGQVHIADDFDTMPPDLDRAFRGLDL